MATNGDDPISSRKQAADGNGVSLREFFEQRLNHQSELFTQALDHQTKLLDQRAKHHDDEHIIHIAAHAAEHAATQTAIKVATDALDKRLESMDKEVGLKLDTLSKGMEATVLDRANTRGYILGMGAVIGVLVIVANFVVGFIGP